LNKSGFSGVNESHAVIFNVNRMSKMLISERSLSV
jgi:hypothetical protein